MTTLDTHALFKELVAIGISKVQAEGLINKFATKNELEEIKETLVTKTELRNDIVELKIDIAELKSELKSDISKLSGDVVRVKIDILQWMIPLFLTIIGLIISLYFK